ncbi:hypothetical protein [Nannocystis pusilla]|uniref:hypothetical protein n=1 Tax=Nannocystis pusilla TaxID=889268 RepID=UPI003B7DCACE
MIGEGDRAEDVGEGRGELEALSRGELDATVLAGIESALDSPYLDELVVQGRFRTADRSAGIVPGERAAAASCSRPRRPLAVARPRPRAAVALEQARTRSGGTDRFSRRPGSSAVSPARCRSSTYFAPRWNVHWRFRAGRAAQSGDRRAARASASLGPRQAPLAVVAFDVEVPPAERDAAMAEHLAAARRARPEAISRTPEHIQMYRCEDVQILHTHLCEIYLSRAFMYVPALERL